MAPPVADAVDIGGQWVKRRQVAARPVSRARPRFATLDARGVKAWVHGGGADVAEGAGNSRGVSRGGASVQPDVCRRCSTAVFNDRVQRSCSTTVFNDDPQTLDDDAAALSTTSPRFAIRTSQGFTRREARR